MEGQTLHFLYAGSNNQNFVLRDAETGTWWQQVTGEAIIGPGKGKRLDPFAWDEINFGIFRREHPDGLVLRPGDGPMSRYPFARYRRPEANQAERRPLPSWYRPDPDVALGHHDIVVSVQVGERAKAYPLDLLIAQNPIQDRFGGLPLLVVVASDGKSTRTFDRTFEGQVLELYVAAEAPAQVATGAPDARDPVADGIPDQAAGGTPDTPGSGDTLGGPDAPVLVLVDAQTGSTWDFSGTAIDGPLAGRRLQRVQTVRDYWFDWRRHHPDGPVYLLRR